MSLSDKQLEQLGNPTAVGAVQISGFIGPELLSAMQAECSASKAVPWRDNHSVYSNKRNRVIIQNHDVYALKLSAGDQSPLERIPDLCAAAGKITGLINHLSQAFPSLQTWKPDELTLHRYDYQEIGLSYHMDNLRFVGLIAIQAVQGECELRARNVDRPDTEVIFDSKPGDLFLLRAPGLIEADGEIRPEHSVVNLSTPTRTSMMLRDNIRPLEAIQGFVFDNWTAS